MRRIASKIRLRQANTADDLTSCHFRQPALFLLFRAEGVNREHRQRPLHRDERAQPAIASLQLLAGKTITHSAETGASISFEVHPQQAKLGHFGYQLARKRPRLKML